MDSVSIIKGIFVLILEVYIIVSMWLHLRERMMRFGWYNRKKQEVPYSIFLVPVYQAAPNKSGYLVICIILNFVNLFSGILGLAGYLGCIINHCRRGPLFYLMLSPIITAMILTVVELICRGLALKKRKKGND